MHYLTIDDSDTMAINAYSYATYRTNDDNGKGKVEGKNYYYMKKMDENTCIHVVCRLICEIHVSGQCWLAKTIEVEFKQEIACIELAVVCAGI